MPFHAFKMHEIASKVIYYDTISAWQPEGTDKCIVECPVQNISQSQFLKNKIK